MGSHPINLTLRFLLEITALVAGGMWGSKLNDNWTRYIWVIAIPVVLAVLWGTFAVPDDPSRSGNAPVVTPGLLRLILELAIFAFATWAFYSLGHRNISLIFGGTVVLHYLTSYDRIMWLLAH